MIPDEFKAVYCYGDMKDYVKECQWFITSDCPDLCSYARRIKQGTSHTSKTGLERFLDRWGLNWNKIKQKSNNYQI